MKKALVALIAAAALVTPAVAQQQDPNKSPDQNAQNQNAQENTPVQSDQQQGGQNAGQSDQQQRGPSPAMHPGRPQVRMLQQALNRNGLNAGPVDGIMGNQTRQALQKFQSQHGLNASGQLDRQTIAALRSQRGQSQTTAKTNKRTTLPQNQGQQGGRY
jgi:peptidoglycan hydrolase-like protein with peptidoglycan-binding domain